MVNTLKNYLVNGFAASPLLPGRMRKAIYRALGMKIDTDHLHQKASFKGYRVEIGPGSFINYGVHFDCEFEAIKICRDVGIGPGVMLITTSHAIGPSAKRAAQNTYAPITIEDGCWLGACSTILSGVTIGRGVIVAAGAVVTKDCLPDGLYGGVPAVRIRDLD